MYSIIAISIGAIFGGFIVTQMSWRKWQFWILIGLFLAYGSFSLTAGIYKEGERSCLVMSQDYNSK